MDRAHLVDNAGGGPLDQVENQQEGRQRRFVHLEAGLAQAAGHDSAWLGGSSTHQPGCGKSFWGTIAEFKEIKQDKNLA